MHVAAGAAGSCRLASEVVNECNVAGIAVYARCMTQVMKRCAGRYPGAYE